MASFFTGGAGFIGSIFILDWLQCSDEPVLNLNLNLLTYAGNPENLAAIVEDPKCIFVTGDIDDAELAHSLLAERRSRAYLRSWHSHGKPSQWAA